LPSSSPCTRCYVSDESGVSELRLMPTPKLVGGTHATICSSCSVYGAPGSSSSSGARLRRHSSSLRRSVPKHCRFDRRIDGLSISTTAGLHQPMLDIVVPTDTTYRPALRSYRAEPLQ